MEDKIPLSGKHSKGFGYIDYFTKNKKGKGLLEVMKKLSINGPMSKYNLSKKSKKRDISTSFSWVLIHKYINILRNNGLVKEFGKQQGPKHESTLYGLTFMGIVVVCMTSKEIFESKEKIITNYKKHDGEYAVQFLVEKKIMDVVVDNEQIKINDEPVPFWRKVENLIQILSFIKDAKGLLPKTTNVFSPENLTHAIFNKSNIDFQLFTQFYNTLSEEIIELTQNNGPQNQLNEATSVLNEHNLLQNLINWMYGLQGKIELRSHLLKTTVEKLELTEIEKP